MYRFHGFELDVDRLELRSDGEPVSVEPQVFSLLLFLIENRDRVISKDELIASVWNGRIVSDATLNSRVNSLRRAVGDTGKSQQIIKTYPRRGFRFAAALESSRPVGQTQKTKNLPRDHPSIVVLPFQFLAEANDQAYLAHGITEEIITALSRIRWLFVIAQTSSLSYGSENPDWPAISNELDVDYALTGTVYKSGSAIRVTAHLTNVDTHQQVWSDRFDGQLTNVFDLHDEIAFAIASHLEPEITHAEMGRLRGENRPGDLTAWQHYLRAAAHLNKLEPEENEAARDALNQAIEIDPDFLLPQVALAWCWALAALHGWCRSGSEALALSSKYAREALNRDPGDARAYCAMAFAEFWVGNQSKAIEFARQSLDLNPNMVDAHGILGAALAVSGEPEKSIHALQRALSGSPREPMRWFWYHSLANAYFTKEDYAEACSWAEKAIQAGSSLPQSRMVWAASLAYCGNVDAAGREIERLAEASPNFSTKRVERNPMWTDKAAFERLLKGARSAGLS